MTYNYFRDNYTVPYTNDKITDCPSLSVSRKIICTINTVYGLVYVFVTNIYTLVHIYIISTYVCISDLRSIIRTESTSKSGDC